MDQQPRDWKLAVERFCSANAPDWHEIARLVTEIASASDNQILRQAAMQALPSLRNASVRWADGDARVAARRRLAVVLDVLNTLSAPRFGKRGGETKVLTSDERYRQLLGLPFGRYLPATEIHRAFKRAAKTAHPDGGGSEGAFLELSAARDALMKFHGGGSRRAR